VRNFVCINLIVICSELSQIVSTNISVSMYYLECLLGHEVHFFSVKSVEIVVQSSDVSF
jgi:hypothetical protein